ncbi:hypothetical protein SKAU_G00277870 [Synaphobranchus kaupii]|uniref:Peptidase M12A domain-containing protein n=1 Tax=Synaphobranchus kaupii TaxID=118154 RepID=A0A9Q1EWJ8_SYNKA|nr:hypothetical protein SKAU_G00277860 [Synaphobranchus kaupii]KAJ8346386.1 hypothetical protein SKAU_G00277870 [Synaphobranchus kaupii]
MDHRLVSTILALLLSLSQAHELVDLGSEDAYYAKKRIENAMKTFNTETCIRFVPRSSQIDFISIENRDG